MPAGGFRQREKPKAAKQDKIDKLRKSASTKQARVKELDELLRMVDYYYKSGKPVADKLKSIRFEKSRQKYKAEHSDGACAASYRREKALGDSLQHLGLGGAA